MHLGIRSPVTPLHNLIQLATGTVLPLNRLMVATGYGLGNNQGGEAWCQLPHNSLAVKTSLLNKGDINRHRKAWAFLSTRNKLSIHSWILEKEQFFGNWTIADIMRLTKKPLPQHITTVLKSG